MTKNEMMLLTIKQLINHFNQHPECFALEEQDNPDLSYSFYNSTIVFQNNNDIISNPRTVMVTFNSSTCMIDCKIYFRTVLIGGTASNFKPDASMAIPVTFKMFNKPYRMFKALRTSIVKRKKDSEGDEFLKKLHSVFPGTFDDYIFGKQE